MKKLYIFFLILILTTTSSADKSRNMTLLGKVNPHAADGRYSSCWGWTSPTSAKEYALLGCYNGTSIIDISFPDSIREVGFLPGQSSGWREMKAKGQYAYIVSDQGGVGLQIANLTNPAQPALVKEYTTPGHSHTVSIEESHNRLYLNGTDEGMYIMSIVNPANPVDSGTYTVRYVHDCYSRGDTVFAAELDSGLSIINGANPKNPQVIQRITYSGSGTHNAWTSDDRKYLFTTDEIATGSTKNNVKVWDIQNLQNIRRVAEWGVNGSVSHNIFIRGRFAYVAHYGAGMRMVDVLDPTLPVEVGYYDTDNSIQPDYTQIWGAYCYFASGKIIASNMQTGLEVFTFNNTRASRARLIVLDDQSKAPVSGVRVQNIAEAINTVTNANGMAPIGIGNEMANIQLTISKSGYSTQTPTVAVSVSNTPFDTVYLMKTVGVHDDQIEALVSPRLHISPQPVHETLHLTIEKFNTIRSPHVLVINELGQRVKTISDPAEEMLISAGDLVEGMYAAIVLDWQGKSVAMEKFIVTR